MKLTIFRGLPGSGKTTKAHELMTKTGSILIEPDMFMHAHGIYTYSPERHAEAVERCKAAIGVITTNAWRDCHLYPDIIYADVLPKINDVRAIIKSVESTQFDIEVVDCIITKEQSIERNKHSVRPEDIRRMAFEWQPWVAKNEKGRKA